MDWYRTRQPECIGTIEGPDQSHQVESAKQNITVLGNSDAWTEGLSLQ